MGILYPSVFKKIMNLPSQILLTKINDKIEEMNVYQTFIKHYER